MDINKHKNVKSLYGAKHSDKEMSTDTRFNLAVNLLQNKRFADAEILLKEILSVEPRHSESWFFIALIADLKGLHQSAIEYLKNALKIDPYNLKYIYALGDILYAQNYLDEGVKLFEYIIEINPKNCDGYYNLAVFLQKKKQYEEALLNYKKVLELDEKNINAVYNIGNILIDLEDYKNATQYFQKVIEFDPNSDDALSNLGFLHLELGKHERAVEYLNKAILINPNNFSALNNLGKVHEEMFLYSDALRYFNAAIRVKPDYAEAYSNRGVILNQLKEYSSALIDFERALALNPLAAEVHSNKGNALKEMMKYEEALQSYTTAVSLKHNFAEAYSNRGVALKELKLYEEALNNFEKAIISEPGYPNGYFNKSILLLMIRNFDEGWKLYYDWRWSSTQLGSAKLKTSIPHWDRKIDNAGIKILLWAEQGIGDEIFYFGILKNFTAIKSKITVSADPRLHSLFKKSMPEIELINSKTVDKVNIENLFDYQAPIGDIGFLCEVDKALQNKTAKDFLQINQNKCIEIKNKNPFLSGKFVCGISWKSNNKDIGITKSLNLIDLSPLLSIENVVFVSLQYGSTADEIEFVEKKIGIKIHTIGDLDIFNDIDGLVSLISLCNLVVTTSNITAHLTGAIGKKGMVLIPFSKGKIWYWHSGVGPSLWYPSLELVSQLQMNDWTDPINKCKEWVLGQLKWN